MPQNLLGIDLGGTKIEAALLDSGQPDRPLHRLRVPTEQERGYDHILSQIEKACRTLVAEAGAELPPVIGIGHPGTLDPRTQVLKGSNTQCLNGKPLKADLETRLGRVFELANDANCFALAEAAMGAAKGYETVFGIILGTGAGGGLVVRGKVLNGCHGIAGEWGQIVLDPHGPVSVYGTRGTVEAYLSGPSLEKFYAGESGVRRGLKEIVERADAGADAVAAATLERLSDYFAKAIYQIIDVFDPHAIVIGGGVGNIPVLYTEATRQKIAERIFNPTFEAALLKPVLGDSAGVFGAAMLTA
ncbi:MAG TPA: ROK family protein [Chthoniobacterales bacterium]